MEPEKKTPENLGESYLRKMAESLPLTPEDEEALANLLKRRVQSDERQSGTYPAE